MVNNQFLLNKLLPLGSFIYLVSELLVSSVSPSHIIFNVCGFLRIEAFAQIEANAVTLFYFSESCVSTCEVCRNVNEAGRK